MWKIFMQGHILSIFRHAEIFKRDIFLKEFCFVKENEASFEIVENVLFVNTKSFNY
jgi:hypothetical protein